MAAAGDGGASSGAPDAAALHTLDELELVAALDNFRRDFERLVKTIRKARDAEREAAERVAQIRGELDQKRRAKDGAEQERSDLDGAKRQLEEEVASISGDLHRLAEAKAEAQRDIDATRKRLAELDEVVGRGADWTEEQVEQREREEDEAARQSQLVAARREQQAAVTGDVEALREHVAELEGRRSAIRKNMASIAEATEELKRQAQRLQGKKEEADITMRGSQAEAEALGRRARESEAEAADAESAAAREQAAARALRARMERLMSAYDRLHTEVGQLTTALDGEGRINEVLARDLVELDAQLRERHADIATVEKETEHLRAKHAKASRLIDAQAAKQADVVKAEVALREQRERLSAEASAILSDTRGLRREQEKRRQERELLRRAITSEVDASAMVDRLVAEHGSAASTLRAECRAYREAVLSLRDRIDSLREDRARVAAAGEAASERFMAASSQAKERELKAGQAQRRLIEVRAKIRGQENLLESVRADRASYAKTLRTSERDIESMRRQFQSTTYRIEQLKDELMAKDHRLVKEHFEFKKAEKESERVAADLSTLQNRSRNADDLLVAQEGEAVKLQRIVKEAEDERERQRKEFAAVVGERDVLQAQLVRRDEELTALYEKLKVQKSALARGAALWTGKRREQAAERDRIAELQAEAELARTQVGSLKDMGREQRRLEAALNRERARIRSLSDELQRPVNVHRWRAMQVVDPERYKLVQRVLSLQRRLLEADEKVAQRDLAIQEKERLYVEMREALARQPGEEVEEETAALRADLKAKQKQLRSMKEERETQKALVDELKRAVEGLRERGRGLDQGYARRVRAEERAALKREEEERFAAALGIALPGAGLTEGPAGAAAAAAVAGPGLGQGGGGGTATAVAPHALGDRPGALPAAGAAAGGAAYAPRGGAQPQRQRGGEAAEAKEVDGETKDGSA